MTEQEIFPNLTQEQLAFVRENLTPKFLQKDIQEYYGDTFTVDAYGCCLELKTNLSSNEILFEVVWHEGDFHMRVKVDGVKFHVKDPITGLKDLVICLGLNELDEKVAKKIFNFPYIVLPPQNGKMLVNLIWY